MIIDSSVKLRHIHVPNMKCITARSLSKSYGDVVAVDNIELDVKRGIAFGFLGPNGAGKSTTIKMLTTLTRPTHGTLKILGIDALKNPLQVRHRIGVVLQQPSYEPTLSVEKSLTKYGMMWNVPADESRRRAENLMHDFDLYSLRKKRNEDLSIGQRRRVQVAREFMHDMDLLFLDEPTAGLDPAARRNLLDYLRERVNGGLTVFYTTHILSEADYLCDRIAIIQKGRILICDTPETLKEDMGHTKTITVHTDSDSTTVTKAIAGMQGCIVEPGVEAHIIIRTAEPERTLADVLINLHRSDIQMLEVSADTTTLEEIFLETVKDASGTASD